MSNSAVSPRRLLPLFLGLVVLVIGLFAAFLLLNTNALDGAKRRATGSDTIVFDADEPCTAALLGQTLAVADPAGLRLFNADGTAAAERSGSLAEPALLTNGRFALAYDVGGSCALLLRDDGKTAATLPVDTAVYDAALTADGDAALLRAGADCLAVLEVYDRTGALRYRRNSNTQYLSACALSPDGALLAAATAGEADAAFESAVELYRTGKEEVVFRLPLGAEVLCDLAFLSDGTLCAVGERTLYFLSADGALLGSYAPDGGRLLRWSFSEDGVSVLTESFSAGTACSLLRLDRTGAVLAEAALDGAPLSLSSAGSYTAVLTERRLTVFDKQLRVTLEAEHSGSRLVLMRDDGVAYAVRTGEAQPFNP